MGMPQGIMRSEWVNMQLADPKFGLQVTKKAGKAAKKAAPVEEDSEEDDEDDSEVSIQLFLALLAIDQRAFVTASSVNNLVSAK